MPVDLYGEGKIRKGGVNPRPTVPRPTNEMCGLGSPRPAAWKTETCETCEFQIVRACRVGPPAMQERRGDDPVGRPLYPVVYDVIMADPGFLPACAQWQRVASTEKEKTDGE